MQPTPSHTVLRDLVDLWESPERRGPQVDLRTRLACKTIWVLRAFSNREHLLASWERDVHARILDQSKHDEPGVEFPVPRLSRKQADAATVRGLISRHLPFVIEGYLRDSKAVKEWSLDSIERICGDSRIHVMHDELGADEDTRNYYKYSVSLSTVRSLIHGLRRGDRVYGTGISRLFGEHPEFLGQLDLAAVERHTGLKVVKPEFFIGAPQNQSYFHCATGGNLHCQVHGRKRWVLVQPKHSMWMYPSIGYSESRTFTGSPVISTRRAEQKERYPLYGCIPKFTADLEAGDLLYNPPWWWHEVWNRSESISVAFRVVPGFRTPNVLFDFFFYTSPMILKFMGGLAWAKVRGDGMTLDDSLVHRLHAFNEADYESSAEEALPCSGPEVPRG